MPLGKVSDEEFAAEINNSATTHPILVPVPTEQRKEHDMEQSSNEGEVGPIITSDAIIKRFGQGRHEGDVNVPHSLRKLIGEESLINGRQAGVELASTFNISPSSVSAYKNPDDNSQLSDINKLDIVAHLTSRKNTISKKAINKLGLAISLISEGKLSELKATDLSTVAKNMADVVRKMEPESKEEKVKPVQFIMFAPVVNNEAKYATVVAKDNY